MKTLFTLDYKNYNSKWKYSKRDSARGIIIFSENKELPFNPADKIALVYAEKLGYYKFPGGGIHKDEDKIQALIREVSEEVGLSVIPDSVKEYGVIPRFQKSSTFAETIFDQESFYYFCQVGDGSHQQNLDDYEAEAGFKLQITTIEQAVKKNMQYASDNPFDLAMVIRDTNVLQLLCGNTPEPSTAAAEFLLDQAYEQNPGPWKQHSYEVALAANKIALAIKENHGTMDPEKAYVYGLLHDIGRRCGVTYLRHIVDGYEYLAAMGYENAAKICITHSFNTKNINEYIGKHDVTEEEKNKIIVLLENYEYDDYDRLIQLLDATCNADGTKNLETRMTDVKNRYGSYPETKWNKNYELKAYFEKLMGKDLYEVIS